jgi:hypothetical protein
MYCTDIQVRDSFSWPTLADKTFDAHVQRQMLLAWFCCALELVLFGWKQCVYGQFERCARKQPGNSDTNNRTMLRLQQVRCTRVCLLVLARACSCLLARA